MNIATLEQEKEIYGKLAFLEDRSLSSFARRLMLRALELEYPDAAAQIRAIRAVGKVALCVGLIALSTVNALSNERAFRTPRGRRDELSMDAHETLSI